jgi:hypothetical protein
MESIVRWSAILLAICTIAIVIAGETLPVKPVAQAATANGEIIASGGGLKHSY